MSLLGKEERGQIESYDLMVAGFMAMLIFAGGVWVSNLQTNTALYENSTQDMHLASINAFSHMLSDKNCLNGGIADEAGKVSRKKVDCFALQNYNSMKRMLGIEGYDFYVTITDASNTYLNYGARGGKKAMAVQRTFLMDGSPKKGVLIIYEK